MTAPTDQTPTPPDPLNDRGTLNKESTDLGKQTMSASRWMSAARLARSIVGLVTLSILARFLAPDDFGLMALIISLAILSSIVADLGTRLAIVQKNNLREIETSSAFWLNITISILVIGLLIGFAEPIAVMVDDPRIAYVLRVMAPLFLLTAIVGVPNALLERRMQFSKIASIELFGATMGAIVAVIGVWFFDMGFEALMLQQYVIVVLSAIGVLFAARWAPTAGFSLSATKPLLSFGLYLSGAGVLQYLAENISRPVVASSISTTALGQLSVAQQIILAPIQIVVQSVARVLFPALSVIQDDFSRLRTAQIKGVRIMMVPVTAICFGAIAVRDPLVLLMLGPDWAIVSTLLIFLAINGWIVGATVFNAPILKAIGRSDVFFWFEVTSIVATVIVLFATVPYGLIAVVAGRAAVELVLAPIRTWVGCRLIDETPVVLLKVMWAPLVAGAVMLGALEALRPLMNLSMFPDLLVSIALGGVIFVATLTLLDRTLIRDGLKMVLRNR